MLYIINGVNEDPATSQRQQELLVSMSCNMESHEPTLTHISTNKETNVLVPGRKDEIICCHALWCPSWKDPYLSKEQNWQELKGYLSAPPLHEGIPRIGEFAALSASPWEHIKNHMHNYTHGHNT